MTLKSSEQIMASFETARTKLNAEYADNATAVSAGPWKFENDLIFKRLHAYTGRLRRLIRLFNDTDDYLKLEKVELSDGHVMFFFYLLSLIFVCVHER